MAAALSSENMRPGLTGMLLLGLASAYGQDRADRLSREETGPADAGARTLHEREERGR